jgi:hypothetical protein
MMRNIESSVEFFLQSVCGVLGQRASACCECTTCDHLELSICACDGTIQFHALDASSFFAKNVRVMGPWCPTCFQAQTFQQRSCGASSAARPACWAPTPLEETRLAWADMFRYIPGRYTTLTHSHAPRTPRDGHGSAVDTRHRRQYTSVEPCCGAHGSSHLSVATIDVWLLALATARELF